MNATTTKTWTPDEIVAALNRSDLFVGRAVAALYERQTAYEKDAKVTKEDNKVGFNGVDAEILSSFAEQFKRRGFLTPKQLVIARRKMPKYRKQLAEIAAEKNGQKAPAPAPVAEREAQDEWAEEMKWKALEAQAEAEQEAAAFLSDPDYRD